MIKREVYFQSNDHTLFGLYECSKRNNGKIILLLHGFTNSHDTCPLINEAVGSFLSAGYTTFRFDYYGSGKSDGEFIDKTLKEFVQNTKDAFLFVKNELKYQKIGIWGRSFGAILAPMISWKKEVFASVLISGTAQTHISLSKYFNEGEYSDPFKATGKIKGQPIVRRVFFEQSRWLDNLQKRGLNKSKNILVMQGTKDKTVYDMNWAKELYDLPKNPKILTYIRGADHTYKGYENKVINEGLRWFDKSQN